MIDEPDANALLEAMAATLSDQVVPATNGGAQHAARVVANLCRVLARDDRDANAETRRSLEQLTGHDGPLRDLITELDQMIVEGERLDEILPLLFADAARRAEVSKPGYTTHGPA